MRRSLTPVVLSAVEKLVAAASRAVRPSTIQRAHGVAQGARGVAAGASVSGLSYTLPICQRPFMIAGSPMLRHTRQRLNFLNIREPA